MKKLSLRLFFYLPFLMVILFSCKKELEPVNTPPTANAGPDQNVAWGIYRIYLDGSGSSDAEDNISSYRWTPISGPTSFFISGLSGVRAFLANIAPGIYQFELKVTDAEGLSTSDTVQIFVQDAFPFANAGPDQTITLPLDSTYFDGSNSFLANWSISSGNQFVWTKISGPSSYQLDEINISSFPQPAGYIRTQAILRKIIPGVYIFKLDVTNSLGSDSDTIQVTVLNDPQTLNTVTYHDLIWDQSEFNPPNGPYDFFLLTPIRPDIFLDEYTIQPIQIFLNQHSKWIPVPFDHVNNTIFYINAETPLRLNIIQRLSNPILTEYKSDLRIKLL